MNANGHNAKPLIRERYLAALQNIPAPGTGCNPALLGAANLGVLAGRDPQEIHDDILRAIPQGNRRVSDAEIIRAIDRALADHQGGTFTPRPRPRPVVNDGQAALKRIIGQAHAGEEVDLWEASPVRIWDEPKDHFRLLLETLFKPDDLVWIGERTQPGIPGETIRTASAWIEHFRAGGQTSEHIIINPLTGRPAPKKSGEGETYRGDGNVKVFRHCIVEFDTLSLDDQVCFWSAVKLPIVAIIHSGGKSLHAWLDVQKLAKVNTLEHWQANIKRRLYDQFLAPLGVDQACSNPARLSRLPGHYRAEKQAFQRLLWLSPEGRPVNG